MASWDEMSAWERAKESDKLAGGIWRELRPHGTTRAIAPDGRFIYFDDIVRDGERVVVEGQSMRVHYAPGDGEGEWLVAP